MKLAQMLYQKVAQDVFGTTTFSTRGHTFDLAGDWPVVDYVDAIKTQTGIDVLLATEDDMRRKLDDLKV